MTDTDNTMWPRLLVVGEPVTPEQADDIIVRTTCLYRLYCNDERFMHDLQDAFGLVRSPLGFATTPSVRAAATELGSLNLTALTMYRVYSMWIDGPRGWCDWDGRIGCNAYNLARSTDPADVTAEWARIAAAWPYLDLRAQLLGGDDADADRAPFAQWRVLDGRVTEETPGPRITEPTELDPEAVYRRLLAGGERGVTLSRLRAAIARTRAAHTTTTGGAH